jgi:putative phage-type endonuclease
MTKIQKQEQQNNNVIKKHDEIKKSKSTQTVLSLSDINHIMSVSKYLQSFSNSVVDDDNGVHDVHHDDDDDNAYDHETDDDEVETKESAPVLSDDDVGMLHEEALFIIDEFIHSNPLLFSSPDFENMVYDHVQSMLHYYIKNSMATCEEDDDAYVYDNYDNENGEYSDSGEDESTICMQIDEIVNVAIHDYFKFIRPHRSYKFSFIRKSPNIEKMKKKIEFLNLLYQPEQKTDEWYNHRHGLITASSVWKVFGSQSIQNQLIYEKCMPFDPTKYSRVNSESSLHWGQKYEVLSKKLYEEINGTKVQEFGCIRHPNPQYYFIGASPDGINVCPLSQLYGRMLEIKNVVSREITGTPKEDYWIQMQIQMEVCNLPECDFEETKFTEYEDEDAFNAESTEANDSSKWNYTTSGKRRGVIVYFSKDEKPFYQYAPLTITTKAEFDVWFEETINTYETLTWVKNIYWRLDVYSCVLVLRNKEWFKNAVVKIEELWKTIETEKQTGFEHRAPKRNANANAKKEKEYNSENGVMVTREKVCHLDLNI